jgi:hypothetical protein
MKLDHHHHISTRVGTAISDSGYISHATEDQLHSEASLSEQTINAMLRPQGFRGEVFSLYLNAVILIGILIRFAITHSVVTFLVVIRILLLNCK